MKKITDQEYNEYQKYKQAKAHGRIITPDGLRLICEANGNDPEAIGRHILESLYNISVKDTKKESNMDLFKRLYSKTKDIEETEGTPLFINGLFFNTADGSLDVEYLKGGAAIIDDNDQLTDFLNEIGVTAEALEKAFTK